MSFSALFYKQFLSPSVRPEENFFSNLLRKKFVSKGRNKIKHIKNLLKHEFIIAKELEGISVGRTDRRSYV